MAERKKRSFRIGILTRRDWPDALAQLIAERDRTIAGFRDRREPDLYEVGSPDTFEVTGLAEAPLFSVTGAPQLFDASSSDFQARLLGAIEYWNTATLWLAPQEHALALDLSRHQRASPRAVDGGWVRQNVSDRRLEVARSLLESAGAEVAYCPLAFTVCEPSREQLAAAVERFRAEAESILAARLAGLRAAGRAGWAIGAALDYHGLLVPDAASLQPVGDRAAAEEAAVEHRGLCFLVELETGERISRWAER
jgi:hypothetical protein